MTSCKLCNHPERAAVERKIAAKNLSMSAAAQIVGCDKASVSRHIKKCCAAKIAKAADATAQAEGLNIINQLTESHQTTLQILQDALEDGDRRFALKALEVELRQLELSAKLNSQLSDAPQVNVLLNREFVRLKQVLVKTLEPYPDARLKVSEALTEMADDDD